MSLLKLVSLLVVLSGIAIIGFNVFFGYRRGAYRSFVKLGGIIVAAALALLFAKLISHAFNFSTGFISDELPDEILDASPSLDGFIKEAARAALSPALFALLFPIFALLMKIPERFIVMYFVRNRRLRGDRIWGIAVSFIASIILLAVMYVPLSGFVFIADKTASNVASGEEAYDEETYSDINKARKKYISPLASNPVLGLSNSMCGFMFDSLTSVKVSGISSSLPDEINTLTELYSDLIPLYSADLENYGEAQAAALKSASETVNKAKIVPMIAGELISYSTADWNNGGEFMDKEFTESDGVFTGRMLEILSATDGNSVKSDLSALAELFGVLADHSTFKALSEGSDISGVLCDEGFVSDIVRSIYNYPRFRIFTADLINDAFDSVSESLEIPETYQDAMKIETGMLPNLDMVETAKEAKLIEDITVSFIEFANLTNNNEITESAFTSLGKAFDLMSQSKIIGGRTKAVIEAFLRSDAVESSVIFPEEVIREILRADGNYENMLLSMLKTVSLARAISDKDDSADEAIQWLADNMEASSVSAATSMVTPELFESYGIDSGNAQELTDIISSYIYKLSLSSELNDVQVEAESRCVRYLYSIAKTVSSGGATSLFGGDIPSGGELLDAFMDSIVFSKTVEEAVFGESGGFDPVGVSGYIQESDKEELTTTLENYTSENYSSAPDKEEFERKIESLGSLIGLDISEQFDSWVK